MLATIVGGEILLKNNEHTGAAGRILRGLEGRGER
jgi:N-acyl-D-aspartate/D-glutamate deacylase